MSVSMNWLMEESLQPNANISLARMTVDPAFTSKAHRHSNCNEVIHLVAGKIDQQRDDEWVTMKEGDTIFIPQGTTHQTRNISDQPAVAMVAYSSGSRIYEAVKDESH